MRAPASQLEKAIALFARVVHTDASAVAAALGLARLPAARDLQRHSRRYDMLLCTGDLTSMAHEATSKGTAGAGDVPRSNAYMRRAAAVAGMCGEVAPSKVLADATALFRAVTVSTLRAADFASSGVAGGACRAVSVCGREDVPDTIGTLIDVTRPHFAPSLTVTFGTHGMHGADPCDVSYGVQAVSVYVK